MQKLIILRGVPGSGKSSIARNLRNFEKKIAWLKVDNFKVFFAEDASNALDYVNKSAISTLRYLLNESFSVVMEGVFQNPEYISLATKEAKKKNVPSIVYELECSLPTLIKRDISRKEVKNGCRIALEEKTIKYIFKTIKNSPFKNAKKLNTENVSLDNCVKIIKKEYGN